MIFGTIKLIERLICINLLYLLVDAVSGGQHDFRVYEGTTALVDVESGLVSDGLLLEDGDLEHSFFLILIFVSIIYYIIV